MNEVPMKKICIVTAARSEYGLLKWLIHDLREQKKHEIQLVVTGGHLLQNQGYTIEQILQDGNEITKIVDAYLDYSSPYSIAESMGRMAEGFAKVYKELSPDLLVVLGDRYELFPICNTAYVMRIPIAHLAGGDITEGAIDDGIRNSITMIADYHFPGTKDAAENIVRMRNSGKNVWAVGEMGLVAFKREELLTRRELADNLSLDCDKKWVLMTYHPETKRDHSYNVETVKNCLELLSLYDNLQIVATYANADAYGAEINSIITGFSKKCPDKYRVIPSLGQARYLSYMKQVAMVIGNSSSGIVEAPFLNIPVINIGDRQKGRYQCGNIIQCSANENEIRNALAELENNKNRKPDDLDYWGDGYTSKRILEILRKALR